MCGVNGPVAGRGPQGAARLIAETEGGGAPCTCLLTRRIFFARRGRDDIRPPTADRGETTSAREGEISGQDEAMDATHRQQGWSEAAVDILVEFLEAAVHSLLQARRVYPQGLNVE